MSLDSNILCVYVHACVCSLACVCWYMCRYWLSVGAKPTVAVDKLFGLVSVV